MTGLEEQASVFLPPLALCVQRGGERQAVVDLLLAQFFLQLLHRLALRAPGEHLVARAHHLGKLAGAAALRLEDHGGSSPAALRSVLQSSSVALSGDAVYLRGWFGGRIDFGSLLADPVFDPDDEDAKFNLEFVRDEIRRRHEIDWTVACIDTGAKTMTGGRIKVKVYGAGELVPVEIKPNIKELTPYQT